MIFDAKFDGRKKARFVAEGHRAPELPQNDIYSGVMSIETVRLAFVLASFNGLEVRATDVSNTFLFRKDKEKVYVIVGKEFGENQGKQMIIDKGLYGLASSAARFHDNLAATLRKMKFLPSTTDNDLWMRRNGDHYEYIATYVDDLLVFCKKPMDIIDTIRKTYELKGIGAPEYYLGSDYLSTNDQNEELKVPGIAYVGYDEQDKHLSELWRREGIKTAFSARTYTKNTMKRLETMAGQEFAVYDMPMSESLYPELDNTPLLDITRNS